jgi:hypothetical protein
MTEWIPLGTEPAMIDRWVNRWIGAPFALDGRTTDGIDCYGLVVRFYADLFDIILPDWRGAGAGAGWIVETMQVERVRRFVSIAAPAEPCLALAHRRHIDRPHHIGIHWRRRIIHAAEEGVRADPLHAFALRYGMPEYGHPRADSA